MPLPPFEDDDDRSSAPLLTENSAVSSWTSSGHRVRTGIVGCIRPEFIIELEKRFPDGLTVEQLETHLACEHADFELMLEHLLKNGILAVRDNTMLYVRAIAVLQAMRWHDARSR